MHELPPFKRVLTGRDTTDIRVTSSREVRE
jgi:hypothetical protein